MRQRSLGFKLVATMIVVALQGLALPALAGGSGAAVTGAILSASDQSPIEGARLHLADPKTGSVYSSAVVSDDGAFRIDDVPAASYEVGVELDGGLYVVESPLSIAPGQTQPVHVAIDRQLAPSPEEEEKQKKKGGSSVWNNPATAALIVLGAAIVVGLIIDAATDDDDDEPVASP